MIGEGEVNLLSKFQVARSYGLGEKVFWSYFHKGWITQLFNDLMNDKGVL